jgi:hypothetical protein
MPKKFKKDEQQIHKELGYIDITINPFGEIISNYDIEKLNKFLDKKVQDKKFKGVKVIRTTSKENS